jgi:hypothetical protein
MAKSATFTISISTNPMVSGRYFCDVRLAGRQITRTRDSKDVLEFLGQARCSAEANGVELTVTDETGEFPNL